MSRQSVIVAVYIISLSLIIATIYKTSAGLTLIQLGITMLIGAVLLTLPALMVCLNYRAMTRLLLEATAAAGACLQGKKEISEINTLLNHPVTDRFVDQYNQLVAKACSNCALFGDTAVRLAEDAEHISRASDNIAQSMQQQVADTEQLKRVIDELQTAISVARGVAQSTHQLANQSETEGESGKQVMTGAITGVMLLSASVNEAGEIIQKLGEDSKSIGGIIEVITGVSEQTNLLALNAAIEAARAGDQGRGFAVVADEVRALAEQTRLSAQKINEIINALLNHVARASTVIKNSVDQADKSDELMEGVAVSYSELVGYMKEISAQSNNLQQTMVSSLSSADSAVSNLVSIQSLSQGSIEQTEMLIVDSKELSKMGEQLNIMVATGGDQQLENKAKNLNSSDDSIELF